jgi:hypothetical protein
MSLRGYIFLMLISTLACLFAFLAVVYFFDPTSGGILPLILFYLSLFLTLIGIFSLLGLFARLIFTKDTLVFKKVVTSFRQGIWFALLINVSLYLQSIKLFSWASLSFLILALGILELFFMSYKAKPKLKI